MNPRIVYFGSPDFALPSLETLSSMFKPALIITAPPDPKRGPSPVEKLARAKKIHTLSPQKLTKDLFRGAFDLFIIAAYGKILSKEILAIPKKGTINIHPSLLPKYRGASPIQAATLNDEKETGVTIMLTDELVDHGPIIAQEKVVVKKGEDSVSLSQGLAELGGKLLIQTLPLYLAGKLIPQEQNHARATFTRLLKREDSKIDWNQNAETIERMVRAYLLWPVAWTILNNKRVKLLRTRIGPPAALPPHTLVKLKTGLGIAAKDNFLIVESLQLEGKKPITGSDFARGYGRSLIELN